MRIEDGEIALEMRVSQIPLNISEGYIAEFVWKSTSYDRLVLHFFGVCWVRGGRGQGRGERGDG